MGTISLIQQRRAELRRRLDVAKQFEQLEESCIPSYVHGNPAAAGVAWMRLLAAARLFKCFAPPGPMLDFGSAAGELYHTIKLHEHVEPDYHFCELNDALIKTLMEMNPAAKRVHLESLPPQTFSAIFALDSLEHNENVAELLDLLLKGLAPNGVFILSGPTENWLYRTGRKIAGFSGHYHKTTIANIEDVFATRLTLVARQHIPFGVPLFSVSVWKRK